MILAFTYVARSNQSAAQFKDPLNFETVSNTSRFLQFKTYFGKVGDNYVYIYSNSLDKFNARFFDDEMKELGLFESSRYKEYKSLRFHGACEFNGELNVYFTARSKEVAKGNHGLFKMTCMKGQTDFSPPVLVSEFKSPASISRFLMLISPNQEYLAFVIEPKAVGTLYRYSVLVFDSDGRKVVAEDLVEGRFDSYYGFMSAHVTNTGEVYLLFKDNAEAYTKPAFTRYSEQAAWIKVQKGSPGSVQYFKNELKHILQFRLVSYGGEPFIFSSWCLRENLAVSGVSLIDPATGEEEELYTFLTDELEPFIESSATYSFSDDTERKNLLSDSKVNAYVDLVDIFDYAGDEYYLLQKRTPVKLIVSNGQGATSFYCDVEGDIFLVNSTTQKVVKIERLVSFVGTPRGIYSEIADNHLSLYYYSVPDGKNAKVKAYRNTSAIFNTRSPDLYLYNTLIDMETYEITSNELLLVDEENYIIKLSIRSMIRSSGKLLTIGGTLLTKPDLIIDFSLFEEGE